MGERPPDLPTLGEFVQRKRIQLEVSQKTLAAMVGVSYSYMQKIEQDDVTGILGDAVAAQLILILRLDHDEAAHLRVLAGFSPALFANTRAETDTVRTLLAAFGPNPAARYSGWRIISANSAFALLWPGLVGAPSFPEWLLADYRARAVTPDWEAEVRMMTAWFRGYTADPDPIRQRRGRELLERLWRWPEFRDAWNSGAVTHSRHGRLRRVMVNGGGVEVRVREILLPWPQRDAGFEALFIGLVEQNGWVIEDLLRRRGG